MAAFKPQQRRLLVRGRSFHFVTYEARAEDPRRGQPGSPAMWYVMVEGHRCPVFPWDPNTPSDELETALHRWVADNAFGSAKPPRQPLRPTPGADSDAHRGGRWWGPN